MLEENTNIKQKRYVIYEVPEYKVTSSDTNPEVEKFQISLIRQANTAKRASLMRSLSKTVIQLSRRAISRANPGLNEEEVNLIFVANNYGDDLAKCLSKYLKQSCPILLDTYRTINIRGILNGKVNI